MRDESQDEGLSRLPHAFLRLLSWRHGLGHYMSLLRFTWTDRVSFMSAGDVNSET